MYQLNVVSQYLCSKGRAEGKQLLIKEQTHAGALAGINEVMPAFGQGVELGVHLFLGYRGTKANLMKN
jgi:hypothetical protein